MLEQAKGMLEHLKHVASQPIGEAGLRQLLTGYFQVYPQPERSQGAWAMFWGPYVELLAELSAPALEAGMKAWVAHPDSEFLPKPGKLRELAMTARNPATAAYYIAAKAVRAAEERARMDAQPQLARHEILALPQTAARAMPTEAEREAVRGMAANYRAQTEALKPPKPPPLPPTPVTFAQGLHITEAMVEHLRGRDPDFGAREEDEPTLWPAEEIDPEAFS